VERLDAAALVPGRALGIVCAATTMFAASVTWTCGTGRQRIRIETISTRPGLLPAALPVSVDYVVTASIRIGDHLTIVADGESPEVGSVDVVANGTHAAVAKHELTNARMIAAKLARIPGPRVSLRSIEQKQVERANLLISRDSMMEDALTAESETMATPTGNPWVIFRYEVGMLYALIPYLKLATRFTWVCP
jgi:hypothetical protein